MLALATTLFTTLSAELAIDLHWVAHIQIFPLALAGSIAGILAWLALTLVFGRIYCSTVCPMGILQDVFARVPRLGRRRRFRNGYRYEEPRNKFRYTWLTVVVGCSVAGIALAATLFDPYSAFGRICSEILLPVWEWVCGAPVLVPHGSPSALRPPRWWLWPRWRGARVGWYAIPYALWGALSRW